MIFKLLILFFEFTIMVTFEINEELDAFMAMQFLGSNFGGVDFGQNVWEYHPTLKNLTKKDSEIINKYFADFYKINSDVLKNTALDFQNDWITVENHFISLTKELFNGYEFPKGSYIGYVSSYNCNPRFLEDKSFQLFYKSKNCKSTTSHELMHFIFYAYTKDNFIDIVSNLNENNGLWWNVAEVFNNVILSLDNFQTLLNTNGDKPYPDHVKYFVEASKLYKQSKGINKFILSLFDLLK